jgi:hypothetical protein
MGICNSKGASKKNIEHAVSLPLEYEDSQFTVDLFNALRIYTTSKRTIINSIKIYRDINISTQYYLKLIYPSEYHMQYNQVGEILFIEFSLQPMDIHIWAKPSYMAREIIIRKSMKKIRLLVSSNIY